MSNRVNRRYLALALTMAGILILLILYSTIRLVIITPSADQPAPSIVPPSTTIVSSSATHATCGAVATVSADGQPLAASTLDMVRAVHDAACRRDHEALINHMTSPFDDQKTPDEVVAEWRRDDPRGLYLAVMASTLETKGHVDQGGLTFCQPRGAVVVFARGTYDHPGGLSAFHVMREHSEIDMAC